MISKWTSSAVTAGIAAAMITVGIASAGTAAAGPKYDHCIRQASHDGVITRGEAARCSQTLATERA
jgi:hypothetical protein